MIVEIIKAFGEELIIPICVCAVFAYAMYRGTR